MTSQNQETSASAEVSCVQSEGRITKPRLGPGGEGPANVLDPHLELILDVSESCSNTSQPKRRLSRMVLAAAKRHPHHTRPISSSEVGLSRVIMATRCVA